MRDYYNEIWQQKLSLPQYATLDARWRSRWEFAFQKIPPGSTVLDGGCGDGVLGERLVKEKGCEVYGLDVSKYALDIARDRGIKTHQIDISCDPFPFEDDFFDFAVFLCSLEHIVNAVHPLKEASRVVRPNGRVLVTLPNATYIVNRLTLLGGRLPLEFLHIRPGEGMHMQFYNYSGEFEERVLSQIPALTVQEKIPDFKNPKKYKGLSKKVRGRLLKLLPNLFAEYTHWELLVNV